MSTRLFVLGALRSGPMHGYLVRREAEIDRTEAWADIKPGSIHNALRRLEQEGLVTESAVEQGAGPVRTVYALTDQGRDQLRNQVSRTLAEPRWPADPLDVALRLADELDERERHRALSRRHTELSTRLTHREAVLAEVRQHLTEWELTAFIHVVARLRFEVDWLTELLEGPSAGERS